MVRKKNTDLPAFARQEVKISVNGPHNVPPDKFLWKRKVYVMGPILYFPGEGKSLSFICLFFFYIEQGFDRLAHGQRSRSEKGDWLTGLILFFEPPRVPELQTRKTGTGKMTKYSLENPKGIIDSH